MRTLLSDAEDIITPPAAAAPRDLDSPFSLFSARLSLSEALRYPGSGEMKPCRRKKRKAYGYVTSEFYGVDGRKIVPPTKTSIDWGQSGDYDTAR